MSLCPFVCSFLSVSAVGVDDRSLFVSSGSCSCSACLFCMVAIGVENYGIVLPSTHPRTRFACRLALVPRLSMSVWTELPSRKLRLSVII